MSKHKHLTFNERLEIECKLNDRTSFKAIASGLQKDCSTISKEIRNHLVFEKKGAPYRPFNNCIHRYHCSHSGDLCNLCSRKSNPKCASCGKCAFHCPDYQKEDCPLLDKPPYVCNGCPKKHLCTLEKRMYHAKHAQQEYEAVRSESRSGVNLTEEERQQLDSVISPLIQNGQSLHHIMVHNADRISCCEKTAYAYLDNGLFEARNLDMPRKVRFRPRKKKSRDLKVDKSCRIGRSYLDFQTFCKENPSLPVVQLDSVEGLKGGAVLLTVHFVRQKLQLAFLRPANTSHSVTDIFRQLYDSLGHETYCKLFPILLCDNGSEFSNPKALEFDPDGNRLSHVFYCNPSSPQEKGACEVNHEFIRRIIPKGLDIGTLSVKQIRLVMDHINSYTRPDLGDKSPIDMFRFYYGDDVLAQLDIVPIPPNEVVLNSSLLQYPVSDRL